MKYGLIVAIINGLDSVDQRVMVNIPTCRRLEINDELYDLEWTLFCDLPRYMAVYRILQ